MNNLSFHLELKKLSESFSRLSKECDLKACLSDVSASDRPFALFSACDMFDSANRWYIDLHATSKDVVELINSAYNSLNL